WPGASPHEIEREIIQEQDEQLKNVEGVIKMSSECSDSQGRITLEFAVGTPMSEALLKVNTRLQQVREYPIDATEPVISSRDLSERSIARLALMPRPPSLERIEAFQAAHPDLAEALEPARRAMNIGLRVYRLERIARDLGGEHPELFELLPPPVDLTKLRRFTEDVVEARLERVPGVGDAEVNGGLIEELQVIVDPRSLAAHKLTVADVREALRGQNIDVSGGDFSEGKRREAVRTLGQFRDPEQVKNQVLAVRNGQYVFVRDVADVRRGYKKETEASRRYESASITLSVQRTTGANVVEVMDGIKTAMAELNVGPLRQENLELYLYYDETEYIDSAMGLVRQNIVLGGALTMIVLLLFLHRGWWTLLATPVIAATAVAAVYVSPWLFAACLAIIVGVGLWHARAALIIGLAIPTSIVGTFLLLGMMNRSLNVISLAGMAFAVGMLVDNAIVVLENIHRHWESGEPPVRAAVRGTSEVAGAVVASTLTTIAVFLPVIFVQEMAGQLFRDIALAITCAVGLSLVVSFTLIPTAAARLLSSRGRRGAAAPDGAGRRLHDEIRHLKRAHAAGVPPSLAGPDPDEGLEPVEDRRQRLAAGNGGPHAMQGSARRWSSEQALGGTGWILRSLDALGRGFVGAVVGLNRWIQRSRALSLGTVAVLLTAALGLSWALWPDVEYLPTGNRNFVFMSISPPPGYNIDQLAEIGRKIEADLKPYWDVDPGSPAAAALEYPVIDYYFFVVRGRQVFMGFRSHDPMRAGELIPLIREVGNQFPGTIAVARQSSLFERGSSGGRSIDVEIIGPDLEDLVAIGRTVLDDVQRLIPGGQALPRPSLNLASPEVHVEPKLVSAAEHGLTNQELGYAVDALVDGAYAGDYFTGGNKIDVTIMSRGQTVSHSQDLKDLPIATPRGHVVALGTLADITLRSGPEQINRRERQRAITIQVTPPPTMPLEQAMQIVSQEIVAPLEQSGRLQGGYRVILSGTADQLQQAWNALKWNFLLALLITYLLMAALFESYLYPFVIILTVPLGAVGGILGLWLLNRFVLQPLDVLTMLGFVILIGTVVNNAILIVHQSLNHMRDEGLPVADAITESVRNRIRPIFMTTLTTVLGLLPLVLFPGPGSELYRGLGSVVLGGLLVSAAFTLVLVPTVFRLAMDARSVAVAWLGGAGEAGEKVSGAERPPADDEPEEPQPRPRIREHDAVS
ncbi:MAG TPA: efflux RND transporter permease subunit, partial [Planctomycetaceae bacterium]|nr:efflux RND transporter permease subunit [Planctomycetaceae bacterium]